MKTKTWNAEGPCGEKNPRFKNKSLKTCKTKGGEVEKYLKEADVPLVGCFANDTENRFTAGIANNSEEIKKKFTSVTFFEPQVLEYHVYSFIYSFLMWTLEFNHKNIIFLRLRNPTETLTDSCRRNLMFEDADGAKHGGTSSDGNVG